MVFIGDFATLLALGLSLLSLVLSASLPLLFQKRKFIILEYLENCDRKVYPFHVDDFKSYRNGTEMIFNAEETISRDIKDPISYYIRIEKCSDKSNLDTCKYYNSWRFDNMCPMLKVIPFTKLSLDSHIPPLPCPFKKNHYSIKNARVDTNAASQFLSEGNFGRTLWKLRAQFLEMNKTIACVDFAFRIATTRH